MSEGSDSVRRYTVVAGLLLLISLVAGGVGEVYVPTKLIVSFGFVARNFALVLFPAYASDLLLIPMPLAMLLLALWLLGRGINVSRWEERTARDRHLSSSHHA